tara:strand:+ start:6464 stop:7708 length:1245 start_codon:yes stop_codon:yes gene_type:complete
MSIIGLRDSSNFTTDLRPKNYREGLMLNYRYGVTNKAQLAALTSLMKTRKVDDPEFNWWEKNASDQRFLLHATTGDLTTGTTTFLLAATSRSALELKAGDILQIEHTNEAIRISADPTIATSFTAERGVGGTTAAVLDPNGAGVNPYLTVVGSGYEEGSNAPTGIQRDPSKYYNYCQIFRQTLEFTNTAIQTNLRLPGQVAEAKREALELLGQSMEWAFFEGNRVETTKNGKPYRMMGGLRSFMPAANIVQADAANGEQYQELEEKLKDAFKYGSDEKMAFCGDRAMLTIQQIVRKNSSMQISPMIKEFGMNVQRLTTPFGELVLKRHPMFSDRPGGTTGGTAYYGADAWCWIMDMSNLQYVHLQGRDIKYEPKLQAPDLDGEKSGYLGELSIEVRNAASFYLIEDLASAAVDA